MIKLKILALGNDGKFNYVTFAKTKEFFIAFAKLLMDGLSIHHVNAYSQNDRLKQARHYNDCHINYSENKMRVDAFFGKKVVNLVFHCTQAQRKKFMKVLQEVAYWKKKRKITPKKKIVTIKTSPKSFKKKRK